MKKKKADLEISLFPFLSILACVIGILTLMITAIVIAQIDPEAVNEKIETALEDDEEFQKKIEERKKELKDLRDEIEAIKKDPFKKIDLKKKDQLKYSFYLIDHQLFLAWVVILLFQYALQRLF